ncbi:hypothetical protein TSUD_402400 [Trifolium subterraneum]|uniref:Uncharacterized protein n=1 Tax=Trifolium subterraneum TaxID=3900 RepID=A0A2Z6PC58_TRISU|nr:hypothetical protein TSUD_402400 [Trifolium subterraneum]
MFPVSLTKCTLICCFDEEHHGKNSTYFATLLFEQSEADCKDRKGLKFGGNNRKGGLFERTDNNVIGQEKDLRRWSSQHSVVEPSLQTRNYDDAVSTASSGLGCDEKTIRAVCEQKSVQMDQPGGNDIYETVRSEVRRVISEIQIDLESVSFMRSSLSPSQLAVNLL